MNEDMIGRDSVIRCLREFMLDSGYNAGSIKEIEALLRALPSVIARAREEGFTAGREAVLGHDDTE